MSEAARKTIQRVNGCLKSLLEDARRALRGERNFGVEEIRKIRQPLDEMNAIVAGSEELRQTQPELTGDLDLYKSQLGDLQATLAQIRVMLLARQAALEAGRAQLAAVSQWAEAFHQTR